MVFWSRSKNWSYWPWSIYFVTNSVSILKSFPPLDLLMLIFLPFSLYILNSKSVSPILLFILHGIIAYFPFLNLFHKFTSLLLSKFKLLKVNLDWSNFANSFSLPDKVKLKIRAGLHSYLYGYFYPRYNLPSSWTTYIKISVSSCST